MSGFVFSWYLQDLLAVLSSDAFLIPDIFLGYLVYYGLSTVKDPDDEVLVLWLAFLGGLMWDFRWFNMPGLFALIYVFVFLAASWSWNLLPESGKTGAVMWVILWCSLFPGYLASLYIWGVRGETFMRSLAIQQIYSLSISTLFTYLYIRKLKSQNA